jgi:CheY-like chemotaxis protein
MANILWIEDEASRIQGIMRPLEREGHRIDVAPDKLRALDLLSSSQYDLILLDIIIPDGADPGGDDLEPYEGIRVLQLIRRELHLQTPVIIFSVVNETTVREATKRLGVQKILSKGSLLPSDMKSAVHEVLGIK